ncbi:MAG TPA: Z1 domain-containing protein [Streptosporangiaceae bacterium]|nr:Z1 domain-containing protein [Streptosporangiaceae bacterium]
MVSEGLVEAYLSALRSMADGNPKPLVKRASLIAEDLDPEPDVSADRLIEHLRLAEASDSLLRALAMALFGWDSRSVAEPWTAGTEPNTYKRRTRAYEQLGLDAEAAGRIEAHFPPVCETSTMISANFEAWYPPAGLESRAFYWDQYERHLLDGKGWPPDAVAGLDEDTRKIIERISDPTRTAAFPARGLVVGYVQSGKTANFTGVIAKGIDAGYRLIIVLAGTLDILREQTQRRLDMELVGKENILQDWDENDPELEPHDYADDADWADKFISFGFRPSSRDLPDIIRLTGGGNDFRKLGHGIVALEMQKKNRLKPLYEADNLFPCGARLAVVKKNSTVLKRLVSDLKKIRKQLGEIPTLIIDDESDQASVNTTDPRKWKEGETERTSINRLLSELLTLLPRAQYIGYTATPYANVFVDPEDAQDIFPKDFLLALRKPRDYMGVGDFHDIDVVYAEGERNPENSNEKAFVRDLKGDTDDERRMELAAAVDAFVLSGAIKLYRENATGKAGTFRHHTMLVNESFKRNDHWETAEVVKGIWQEAGYTSGLGYKRLRDLYESDFLPVCAARSAGQPYPADFDELKAHLGDAVRRIGRGGSPVIVVNSDKDLGQESVDFDKRPVWRILVGGMKLSRGFTVEGLSVSYYRRRTKQAATLMQMGRWFGFRAGYRDLVRLYIGRNEQDCTMRLDLYEAFGAMVRDEEGFRGELERYSQLVDGVPQVTPRDIPPLVSQRLPWLKPEAANKMYNAELVTRRSPGVSVEARAYPESAPDIAHNYARMLPIFEAATELRALKAAARVSFEAYTGVVNHTKLLSALGGLRWMTPAYFQPDLNFLEEAADKERIDDWLVIVPLHKDHVSSAVMLPGLGRRSVFERTRQEGKSFGPIAEPRHRVPAKFIAGADQPELGDEVVESYTAPRRGALLAYPVVTKGHPNVKRSALDPADVFLAFELWAPVSSCPPGEKLVYFRVRNDAHQDQAIIDTSADPANSKSSP